MTFECRNITYTYPNAANPLFEDLSFRLLEPGFDALFGPSGIGKTSLAKIIIGHIRDYAGSLHTDGMQSLFYTYNMERLPGWSSVGKHLEKITPSEHRDLKNELIGAFGVHACMESRFDRLSLGQQNRVNLIRYLVQDFDLLIMDESLANVDEKTREQIIFKIKSYFPRTYFLYISHNVVEVSKFCKEIIVFRPHYKQPQVIHVAGHDLYEGGSLDKRRLETTMLEIMNAG